MSINNMIKKNSNSGDVAKDRLRLVLVSDRANCSPEIMGQLKKDILNVITKYIDIEEGGINITISHMNMSEDNKVMPVLNANIPIKDLKYTKELR